MKRRKNAMKCSAFRMLPGIASSTISLDKTARELTVPATLDSLPGLASMSSSSRCSLASCRPATSFSYSFCSFSASVRLILPISKTSVGSDYWADSSILSPILLTLRAADSSIGLVRSTDSDSMQTLSGSELTCELYAESRTYVVRLVKHHNTLLGHLGRYLFGDFGIEQVVEGVDDHVEIWQLPHKSCSPALPMPRTMRRIAK